MPACENCRHADDVRLFEFELDGRTARAWWCQQCASLEYRQGFGLRPAPVWIERAALRQLPVKELPASAGRAARLRELLATRHDRRRGERRGQRVS